MTYIFLPIQPLFIIMATSNDGKLDVSSTVLGMQKRSEILPSILLGKYYTQFTDQDRRYLLEAGHFV